VPWQNVSNAGTSSQDPAPFGTALYDEPYGTIARSFPRFLCLSADPLPSTGVGLYRQLILPGGLTAGAMTALTASTAKLGGTHGWYAITDMNLNVLAVTADQTDAATTWGTTYTPQKLPFTAPLTTAYTGIYYAAICVTATTMPNIAGASVQPGCIGAPPVLAAQFTSAMSAPPAVGTQAPAFAAFSVAFTASLYVTLSVS